MDWQNYLVLFGTAMLGGAVNAVAGGGTLLTFPALLWAGQLEIVANATSTVALWPGAEQLLDLSRRVAQQLS